MFKTEFLRKTCKGCVYRDVEYCRYHPPQQKKIQWVSEYSQVYNADKEYYQKACSQYKKEYKQC